MKKLFLSVVMGAAIGIVPTAFAMEVAGVALIDKVMVAENQLQLNGAGVRKKMIFDVYLASLYVSAKSADATQILTAASPRRLQLNMLRTVDAKSLYEALQEGLQHNVSATQLKQLAPKLTELEKIFIEMKSANKGDVIVLDFIPNQGTKISLRGQSLGVIEGDAFAVALLSIWLGKVPVSDDLKAALLGKG